MSLDPEIQTALTAFRHSLVAGRLAHAYLITGSPRGGGRLLAERVAALLYCKAPGERPCGSCAACRRVAARIHPDVLWVEPQKKSRGILKEQISSVQDHINMSSFEGGWKVVVFLNADRLNPQAANRLLKTLEEPPDKCLFLLVTDQPQALLPTVLSRCQRVTLPPEDSPAGAQVREAVIDAMTGVEGRSLVAAVARARKVMAFLKKVRSEIEGMVNPEEDADEEATEEIEAAREIQLARIEGLYKEAVAELLRWLLLWQRDVLLQVVAAGARAVPAFPDQARAIQQQAAVLTYSCALNNINTVEDMRWQVAQSLPVPVVMERGFIRLTACPQSDATARSTSRSDVGR